MNKYKEFQQKIDRLTKELEEIKTDKSVKELQGDKWVEIYDKRLAIPKEQELLKAKYDLETIKYLNFRTTKRKLMVVYDSYIKFLNEVFEHQKNERTEKTSIGWMVDEFKVNDIRNSIELACINYKNIIEKRRNRFLLFFRNNLVPLIIILLVLTPIVVKFVVSIELWNKLDINNDWIGFFGSYFGGILGATIGGFVAYKIALHGMKNQKDNDLKMKTINLRIEIMSELLVNLRKIKAKINHINYYVLEIYSRFSFGEIRQTRLEAINNIYKKTNIEYLDLLNEYEMLHAKCSNFIKGYDKLLNFMGLKLTNFFELIHPFEDIVYAVLMENLRVEDINKKQFEEKYQLFKKEYEDIKNKLLILEKNFNRIISKDLNIENPLPD